MAFPLVRFRRVHFAQRLANRFLAPACVALLAAPVPAAAQDLVYGDDFETGDTCAWTADGGRCTVGWTLQGGPATFATGTTARGRFFVERLPGEPLPVANPELFRLDQGLQPTGGSLCTLRDDGDVAAGDDTLDDGRYSCFATFDASAPAAFAIGAVLGGVRVSAFRDIRIVTPLTPAEQQVLTSVQTSADQIVQDAIAAHGDTPAARAAAAAALAALPGVADTSVSPDGQAVWIDYTSGVRGAALFIDASVFETSGPLLADTLRGAASLAQRIGPAPLRQGAGRANQPGRHTVGNNRVLIWAPWLTAATLDDIVAIHAIYTDPTSCPPFEVGVATFAAADLAQVDDFPSFGTIVIYTLKVTLQDPGGRLVGQALLSGQPMTAALDGVQLLAVRAGYFLPVTIPERGPYWGFDPDYFKTLESFSDSLVINYFQLPTLFSYRPRNGMLAVVADAEFGDVHHPDLPELCYRMARSGQEVGDASNNLTVSVHGFSDTRYDGGLQDGGFEAPGASPWLAEPDAALVDRLGPYLPTGTGMARISTGLGSVVSSGSIEQSFCLPPNATALQFNWNFLSEEFVEYVGPDFSFDDSFTVELVTRDDNVTHTLFEEDIDSVFDLVGVVPTSLRFDHPANCTPSPGVGEGTGGQDCKVWATDWQTDQASLVCCARPTRRPVTLRLKAADVGDSQWDTAVLVDEISVVAPP